MRRRAVAFESKQVGIFSVLISLFFLGAAAHTFAADATAKAIDIPAGDLTTALEALTTQTGTELVYRPEQVKGLQTKGLQGTYSAEDAISKLLEGTQLTLHIDPSGVFLIATIASTSFSAQGRSGSATADADLGDSRLLQEVVVTGTRILSANLQSISPVTTITKEDLARPGKVRIEDVINQLPQAFAGQGSNIANGADGTATVNLRGLGESRTLVLVNGRRMMPGNTDGGSAADLNQIPLALVKRVEVLTGGASPVYGADAVAGVVNFIMDTDFEGLRFEGNYSLYAHSNDRNSTAARAVSARGFALPESSVNNGYAKDFTVALGVGGPDDRGHATVYATYREVEAVTQAEYDYSACTLNSGAAFSCGGSSISDPGRFIAVNPATGLIATNHTIGANNVLRPFTAADQYNFGPLNYYQRPDERYTAGAFVELDMSERTQAYGELMFMDDRSVAQLAPSAAFLTSFDINCDNPLLSPSMVQTWCTAFGLAPNDFATVLVGRRNTEGGGRQNDIGHQSFQLVAGVRNQLTAAWKSDLYFQHGTTRGTTTTLRDFSTSRTQRALQVRDVAGVPTCISVIDGTDANCVPWNIFQLGGVDADALDYLQLPASIRGEVRQQIAHADLTGDLSSFVKLPTAQSGLALNIGVEYRDVQTSSLPEAVLQAGDLAGQGQALFPTQGGLHVKEVFAEARLPLVEGKAGIETLSIEAGYRYSDYSTGFESDTYKAGFDWAPIKALRLRASYQRAVRAPNVAELFTAQLVRGDGTVDPCEGILGNASTDDDPTATLEQCLRSGMTPAQYGAVPENPFVQYHGLIGGNPQLQPEVADTLAFGLVFQPDFANLIMVVDYFDIEVDDVISGGSGSGNANLYLNSCLDTNEPFFCNLIHRDDFGSLWIQPDAFVVDTTLNLGRLATSGIDLQANYQVDIGRHRLGMNVAGTLLRELTTTPLPGGDSFDCVGFFGITCSTPKAEWRHVLRVDWMTPWAGLDVSASWRYFGSTDLDSSSSDSQLAAPVAPTDARLSSADYFDLTAAISFADKYHMRIGVNNVLDTDPPLVGFANCPELYCNGNTFAQVYDALGRQFFMALRVDF